MGTNEIIRNLEQVIEKHKGKRVGVGEVRIDYLADDCLQKIHELSEDAEKWEIIFWMKDFAGAYTLDYIMEHWSDFESAYKRENI